MDDLQLAFQKQCDDKEPGNWTNVDIDQVHVLLSGSFRDLGMEQVAAQWESHQWPMKLSFSWSDIQKLCEVLQLTTSAKATDGPPEPKQQTAMIKATDAPKEPGKQTAMINNSYE